MVRVRIDESWVALSSSSFTIDELEELVPRLSRVDADLLEGLRRALADWMRRFEEPQDG